MRLQEVGMAGVRAGDWGGEGSREGARRPPPHRPAGPWTGLGRHLGLPQGLARRGLGPGRPPRSPVGRRREGPVSVCGPSPPVSSLPDGGRPPARVGRASPPGTRRWAWAPGGGVVGARREQGAPGHPPEGPAEHRAAPCRLPPLPAWPGALLARAHSVGSHGSTQKVKAE